ncbi:hypothetical protein GOD54_23530 [Sinorhizobium medicae]|nr:hypothetical protein [Sinorhizobium medicae]
MKNMNPDVLSTQYGELVIDLLKTTLSAGSETVLARSTEDTVAYAIRLADQVVEQLAARELKAKEFAEATRVYLPVDWAPDANDDANRSGQHWSQPETDALVAQFKNGKTGSEIAVHHRRTWTAVSAQLEKYGLLHSTGRGSYSRANGDTWDL